MSWLANFVGTKIGESIKDRVDARNSKTQQELLDSGKAFTINTPTSTRYTFNSRLSRDSKAVKDFTPETDKEKETLSPEGYFRHGQIGEERKSLVQKAVEKKKAELAAKGKELTPEREEEVSENAENTRAYEADVPSTAIKYIHWDPKTGDLKVKFAGSNKKYLYPKVPKKEIEGLLEANSKGEYFLQNIHDQYTMNPGHKRSFNFRKAKKELKRKRG